MRDLIKGNIVAHFFGCLVLAGLYIVFSPLYHPFFVMNTDPEAAYLFNGLAMSFGVPSGHVDHPGIPLQLFTAISLRILFQINGDGSLFDLSKQLRHSEYLESIFQDPEFWLDQLSLVLFCLFVILLFVMLRWLKTSPLLTVLIVFLLAANPLVISSIIRYHAETMLIPLMMLYLITLVKISKNKENNVLEYALLGIVSASLVFQKITLLPYLLAPFVLSFVGKRKSSFFVPFFLFSSFYVLFIKHKLDYLKVWFTNLLTKSGKYGSGGVGVDFSENISNLLETASSNPPFFTTFILSTGLSIFVLFRVMREVINKKTIVKAEKQVCVILCITLSNLILILITLKHFETRYLTPVFLTNLLFAYIYYPKIQSTYIKYKHFANAIMLAILTASCVLTYQNLQTKKTNIQQRNKLIEDYKSKGLTAIHPYPACVHAQAITMALLYTQVSNVPGVKEKLEEWGNKTSSINPKTCEVPGRAPEMNMYFICNTLDFDKVNCKPDSIEVIEQAYGLNFCKIIH